MSSPEKEKLSYLDFQINTLAEWIDEIEKEIAEDLDSLKKCKYLRKVLIEKKEQASAT